MLHRILLDRVKLEYNAPPYTTYRMKAKPSCNILFIEGGPGEARLPPVGKSR